MITKALNCKKQFITAFVTVAKQKLSADQRQLWLSHGIK